MTWKPYNLDRIAQKLVLKYRDDENVLNESHKMRTTVAYGLERFWGEHLRLIGKEKEADQQKGKYWYDVWEAFFNLMKDKGINVPKGDIWQELLPIIECDDKVKIPQGDAWENFLKFKENSDIKVPEGEVWKNLVKLIEKNGIKYPKEMSDDKKRKKFKKEAIEQLEKLKTEAIKKAVEPFWDSRIFSQEDQRIALYVLTQLSDSLVWWTQRYKKNNQKKTKPDAGEEE